MVDYIEENQSYASNDKPVADLVFSGLKCNTTWLWQDIERMVTENNPVQMNRSRSFVFDDDPRLWMIYKAMNQLMFASFIEPLK